MSPEQEQAIRARMFSDVEELQGYQPHRLTDAALLALAWAELTRLRADIAARDEHRADVCPPGFGWEAWVRVLVRQRDLAIKARDHYDEDRREARQAEAGWKARAEQSEAELTRLRAELQQARDAHRREEDWRIEHQTERQHCEEAYAELQADADRLRGELQESNRKVGELLQAGVLLDAIVAVLDGASASDFEESFAVVRRVADLKAEVVGLGGELAQAQRPCICCSQMQPCQDGCGCKRESTKYRDYEEAR